MIIRNQVLKNMEELGVDILPKRTWKKNCESNR